MSGKLLVVSGQLEVRLRLALLAGSSAPPRSLAETKESVADLRSRFLARLSDPSATWEDLAEFFISHDASMTKLRSVVGLLMRSVAWDDENRARLFAGAVFEVLRRFARRRDLKYVDGVGSFDSWLYSVWKNAALHANRQLNRGPKLDFIDNERLERETSPNGHAVEVEKMLAIREVWDTIGKLPAGNLRNVMLDWAAGLSGADSARRRRCSEAWVSKLRKRGVAEIRSRLGIVPPAKRG